jgi:hypothetical protein
MCRTAKASAAANGARMPAQVQQHSKSADKAMKLSFETVMARTWWEGPGGCS